MKRLLAGLITAFTLCGIAPAQYVTLTGTLNSSNGLPAQNYIISFTPSQFGFIGGTSVVVNTTTYCATSSDGSVVGVPNPFQAPPVSTGFTGTLPPANYFVKIAFYDASGNVTLVSPERQIQLNSTGQLVIAPPVSGLPTGATGMRVYVSATTNTETLQGSTTGTAAYILSVPLVAGTAMPTANTTVCKQVANDAIWPVGTGYTVALTDPSGNTIPGYPMMWQLMGPNTTINLSNGLPYYHGTVYYPTPVLASPANHNLQSISGPLDLGGYALTGVGSINGSNAIIYSVPGGSLASAIAQAGGNPASIVIIGQTYVPTSLTVPTNIQLVFAGGYLNVSGGQTLTLTSNPVAPEDQQIFMGGTGLVVGLTTVRPEWFGGATPNATAMVAALAACNGGTSCQYLLRAITYPAAWAVTPITQNYVRFIGSGEGDFNNANTAVTGGTILQGPLQVLADYFELHDACIDSGSVLYPTALADGFVMANNGQVVGQPQHQSPLIQNVCVLGQNTTAAVHAVLLENTNNAKVINLRTRFNQDGLVLKGTNTVVDGYIGSGHGTGSLYIKSDSYAPTSDVSISNVHVAGVTPGDTVGLVVSAATAYLGRVTINGFTGLNLSIGAVLNSGSPNLLTEVAIQGLLLETMTQDGIKVQGQVQRLKLEDVIVNNAAGYGVTFQGGNVNYSTASHVQVTNARLDGFNVTGQYNKFTDDYTRNSGGYGFHLSGTSSSAWMDAFTSYGDTIGATHADAGDTIFPSSFPYGLSIGGGITITSTSSFAQYVGAITTTTATSYTLPVASLPVGSHCFVTAQNTTAAGMMTSTYVPLSVTLGSVVVDTNGTAGANINVYCSFQ